MLAADPTHPLCYLSSIKAQEIPLELIDVAEFGISVDSFGFYKNKTNDPDFLSKETIARNLNRIIADHYPILVGRPKLTDNQKCAISVDPNNLNLPSVEDVYVDQPAGEFLITLRKEKELQFFNLKKFVDAVGMDKFPKSTFHKDHSSVVIRLIRFQDNSYVGFSLCLPHVIFDGISCAMFMSNFAAYVRNEGNDDYVLPDPPINDRKIFADYFASVTPEPLSIVKHFKEDLPDLPMEFPKNPVPLLMQTPDLPLYEQQHLLHISAENLERMRQDIDPSQSTNNILMSLLLKCFSKANAETFGNPPINTYVTMAYDMRNRSGIPQNFAGNASGALAQHIDGERVMSSSTKQLAQHIKNSVVEVQSGHSKSLIDIIENDVGMLYKGSIYMSNTPTAAHIFATNLRYIPFHKADFGTGGPDIISFFYFSREGMLRINPNRQDGGLDLFLNYADANFDKLRNSELMEYADVVF
ncbi:hypothetical protein FBU59_002887 [Linderina macrospora]|uniref:Uncharacterized protein n=1 Tax=Linderina macrospora TaxID=4868 RepID=A0ACC1JA08_9FUNG|nr:hypothetical protein FBU59_002887 [Linderina macrospora]